MIRTHTLTIRMTKQERKLLEQAAEDDNRTASEMLRRLLILHLREKGYLKPPKRKRGERR